MTILTHTLGFPRVGLRRELKKAQESYWAGNSTREALLAVGRELRARHWEQQKQAGIDLLPVGDFAWYDHVLTTSLLLGNVPARHQNNDGSVDIDTLFRIGRGRAPTGEPAAAAEMTKWFNTNYHYIVPEFSKGQQFRLTWTQLLEEVDEALALGHKIKPVLLGPVTYLWLGKVKGEPFDRLTLLKDILPVYQHVLAELAKRGIEWVQIDEPALVLELPQAWLDAFKPAYDALAGQVKLLLTTYFEGVTPNLDTIIALPVQGLHVDLIHGKDDVAELHQRLPVDWLLSAGLINGRNVWRADLTEKYAQINAIVGKRALWVASSCSLLHSPIDLSVETRLDTEVKSWFAFALQKCGELALLRDALNSGETAALEEWSAPIQARRHSRRVHNAAVEKRLAAITAQDSQRENPYEVRAEAQRARFKLPAWPTTTIGSFPQTTEIRGLRLDFKKGNLDANNYRTGIAEHIKQAIIEQERLGLDVLVHGEAERNDMVEYFGEHLDGFRFAGSAGGVKNARGFIGFQPRHRHARTEMLLAQRGKIQIAPIHPRHFRQPSVHQQNVFRLMLRLRNSVIKQLFIRQDFTAPRSSIRRHNQRRSGIVNARRHAVRGKTAKDHRMDRANARTGQQGYLRFGNHRHIDQYAIATLHAQRQQHGGHNVDFIMQLAEGKCALFIGL